MSHSASRVGRTNRDQVPVVPQLRFCCLNLHRRLCRPFPRRGSFRLGPIVAKLPLLTSLRPPWTMVSLVRILLHPPFHDQPPRCASRARLGPPLLQRFLPDPPSALLRLCRFGPPPMRLHAPLLLGTYTPTRCPSVCQHSNRSPRYTVSRRIRVNRICRAIHTHSDWAREQSAKPVCDAAIRYLLVDSSSVLSKDFLLHLAPANATRCPKCALSPIKDVFTQTTRHRPARAEVDAPRSGLSRQPGRCTTRLLDDGPMRIYVLLMHPRIMQACHGIPSRHLGVAQMLSMLEAFVDGLARVSVRGGGIVVASNTRREGLARRWCGVAVGVDNFGPLPATPRAAATLFSSRVGSAGAPTCTPSRLRNSRLKAPRALVNKYIPVPLWGCPASPLSVNRLHICSSCRMPCTNFLECEKSPPIIQTAMAASSTSTTPWLR